MNAPPYEIYAHVAFCRISHLACGESAPVIPFSCNLFPSEEIETTISAWLSDDDHTHSETTTRFALCLVAEFHCSSLPGRGERRAVIRSGSRPLVSTCTCSSSSSGVLRVPPPRQMELMRPSSTHGPASLHGSLVLARAPILKQV